MEIFRCPSTSEEAVPPMAARGAPYVDAREDEAALAQKALRNFEDFYKIPRGTATLDQVGQSSAGVAGWADACEPEPEFEDPSAELSGAPHGVRPLRDRYLREGWKVHREEEGRV
jgi:hypothetical protein